jgi:hypothetical protein
MACVYVLHLASSPEDIRYVGMTTRTAKERFKGHRSTSSRGFALPVYDWMRKYEGQVAFTTIADSLTLEEAQDLERSLIMSYRLSSARLLNCNDGGEGGFNPTPETRKKISNASKGRTHLEETRKKLSEGRKGKPSKLKGRTFSEEHRKKMSESQKGRVFSEEQKIKISESLKGRPAKNKGTTHTAETKKKISDSLKNSAKPRLKHSEETKKRMSNAHKGKIVSQEIKDKIRKTLKEKVKIKPEP